MSTEDDQQVQQHKDRFEQERQRGIADFRATKNVNNPEAAQTASERLASERSVQQYKDHVGQQVQKGLADWQAAEEAKHRKAARAAAKRLAKANNRPYNGKYGKPAKTTKPRSAKQEYHEGAGGSGVFRSIIMIIVFMLLCIALLYLLPVLA